MMACTALLWHICFREPYSAQFFEVKLRTGRSYFVIWWSWKGIKGKPQDSVYLHREYEESCYEQAVSWNNATSLLSKSEFIHDYIHRSLLIYSLSWQTFPMQSLMLHNCISWVNMVSCMIEQNMSDPSDNLWHAMSLVILQSWLDLLNSLFNHALSHNLISGTTT